MSVRRGQHEHKSHYGRVPYWVVDDGLIAKMSGTEAKIYVVLCAHADGETGKCWPSLATIAREAGVCRRTAIRAVQRLKAIDAIDTTPGRGRKHATRYTIRGLPKGDIVSADGRQIEPDRPEMVTKLCPRNGDKAVSPKQSKEQKEQSRSGGAPCSDEGDADRARSRTAAAEISTKPSEPEPEADAEADLNPVVVGELAKHGIELNRQSRRIGATPGISPAAIAEALRLGNITSPKAEAGVKVNALKAHLADAIRNVEDRKRQVELRRYAEEAHTRERKAAEKKFRDEYRKLQDAKEQERQAKAQRFADMQERGQAIVDQARPDELDGLMAEFDEYNPIIAGRRRRYGPDDVYYCQHLTMFAGRQAEEAAA